jgi:hypothetical protein
MMLELKTSFLIIEIVSQFPGRLVSNKNRAKKDLKFLKKISQKVQIWFQIEFIKMQVLKLQQCLKGLIIFRLD